MNELLFCLNTSNYIQLEEMKSAQKFSSTLFCGAFDWDTYVCEKWALLTGVLLSVHDTSIQVLTLIDS